MRQMDGSILMSNLMSEGDEDFLYKYAKSKRHEAELDNRQWDCLVMLLDDGTINTLEQLKEYVG